MSKLRRPTVAVMTAAIERFNASHSIGDVIFCRPGANAADIKPVARTIVAPGAHLLGGHTPVVQVSGGGGCIALGHVVADVAADELAADAAAQFAVEGAPL